MSVMKFKKKGTEYQYLGDKIGKILIHMRCERRKQCRMTSLLLANNIFLSYKHLHLFNKYLLSTISSIRGTVVGTEGPAVNKRNYDSCP